MTVGAKGAAVAVLMTTGLLAGCAQTQPGFGGGGLGGGGYQPGLGSPGLGTAAGAAGGAALGRWAAGGNNSLAGILGGAALGAVAGNLLYDGPNTQKERERDAQDRQVANQQQLDFERQRQLQQADTDREIRERQEFEEFKRTRGAQVTPASTFQQGSFQPASTANYGGYADVSSAQRYLLALGYYTGKVDGVNGPGTRSAVTRFQRDKGLSPTGELSPALVDQMRQTL